MKQEIALCPNCGAKGFAGKKCEFCGTLIPLPVVQTATDNKSNTNVRIANSVRTRDLVIGSLLNHLADTEDVSVDLFDDIEIEETKKYLIPFYSYKGDFQAPWTCIKLVKETLEYKDKHGDTVHETKTARYPMNGIAAESYNRLYPACDLDMLPEQVSKFITKELYNGDCIPVNAIDSRELDMDEKACLVADNGKSEKLIWADFNGDYAVERLASWAVRKQFPAEYEDDSWSYTSHRDNGVKILLPVWSLTYSSKGKKYSYISDDYSNGQIFEYPIDADYKESVKSLKKEAESKSMKGCLLGLLGFILGIVSFGFLLSNMTRSNIDTSSDIMLRLFIGDICFVGFAICFLVTKKAIRTSSEKGFHSDNYKIKHQADVYTKLISNILTPNKFSIDKPVNLALAKIIEEKISKINIPTLEKSGTWIWPIIIILLVFALISNFISFTAVFS